MSNKEMTWYKCKTCGMLYKITNDTLGFRECSICDPVLWKKRRNEKLHFTMYEDLKDVPKEKLEESKKFLETWFKKEK